MARAEKEFDDFARRLRERDDRIKLGSPLRPFPPVRTTEFKTKPIALPQSKPRQPDPTSITPLPILQDAPPACCFYSYDVGIGGGDPTFADDWLPATVLFGELAIVLTHLPGGTYTFQSSDGTISVAADPIDTGNWVVGDSSGSSGDQVCLYGKYEPIVGSETFYIFDAYNTTYTLTGGGIGTVTLTRTVATDPSTLTQGSCIWTDGGDNTLQYNSSGPNQYLFTLTVSGTTYFLTGNQTAPNANGSNNYAPYTVA